MSVIRRKALAKKLGVSETTVWRWARKGHLPPPRRFGPNVVGWLEEEIEQWRRTRPNAPFAVSGKEASPDMHNRLAKLQDEVLGGFRLATSSPIVCKVTEQLFQQLTA